MSKSWQRFWLALALVSAIAFLLIVHRGQREAPVPAIAIDLAGIKSTLGMFQVDCGRYPTTAEGLQSLITCPTNLSPKLWKGPYLDSLNLLDPWGHKFVYRCPGIHNTNAYDLYSMGPDGISKSGGGDPDDIGNWLKPNENK
jgi:general secretion pathway protein G